MTIAADFTWNAGRRLKNGGDKVSDKLNMASKAGTGCNCISLIGMAGAGKSTIGALLAKRLGWAFMDTDYLIESLYAARLQDITDAVSREEFLDLEADMIESLQPAFCVIATGGSVVYRPRAMAKLASFGPIAHIDAEIDRIIERIAMKPERGIVLAPGQSLKELLQERRPLYEKYASFSCDSGRLNAQECVESILGALTEK